MSDATTQKAQSTLLDKARPSFSMVGDGRLISWTQRDSMQGFLILLIMIGHNYVLGGTDSALFNWIYASPVILIFFTLPLLTRVKPLTADRARDLATRYMVPYVIFAAAVAVMFWLTGGSDRAWYEQLELWAITMVMNNGKAAFNMALSGYLWFLPAFLAFQLCVGLYYRMSRPVAALFFGALLLAFLFVGQGENSWTAILPFSLGVTIYCLPLSIVIAHGLNRLKDERSRFIIAGLLLAVCVGLTMITIGWDSQYRVHRTVVYSLLQPTEFFIHLVRVVVGSIGLLLLLPALIEKVRLFQWIGQNTLIIYLAHFPIYRALVAASQAFGYQPATVLDGLIILAITLAVSCAMAWVVGSVGWLRTRIMPRNYAEFKEAYGLGGPTMGGNMPRPGAPLMK